MRRVRLAGRRIRALIVAVFIAVALAPIVQSGPALAQGVSKSGAVEKGPDGLPKNIDQMTPAQIDALIAKIGDADARRALLVRLKEAARRRAAEDAGPGSTLARIDAMAATLRQQLGQMFEGLKEAPEIAERAVSGMAPRHLSTFASILLLLGLLGSFAAGIVAEWLYRRWTRGFRTRLATPPPSDAGYSKAGRAIMILLADLVGIGILAAVTFGLFFIFFDANVVARLIVGIYVAAYIVVRLINVVSALFLAPGRPALRLEQISEAASLFLHRWIVTLGAIATVGFLTGHLLRHFGLNDAPHTLVGVLVGLAMAVAIIIMVWRGHALILAAGRESGSQAAGFVGTMLMNVWPVAATVYVAIIWVAWTYRIIAFDEHRHGAAFFALALPLIVLWLDRYFSRAYERYAARKQAEAEAAVEREIVVGPDGEQIEQAVRPPRTTAVALVRIYRRLTRGVLIVGALWLLLGIARINPHSQLQSSVGVTVASIITDIVLIGLITYVVWEIIRITIDAKLSAEGVDDEVAAEGEGEGGGAARSRAGTLLPLFRGFLAVTLIVIAVMVVLSRLGVNIAPLIAGAGVLGLAIGFGAQTLVRDIVSGIFFLADDAFRVGEYVESGRLRGTVEKILIRSLRLRHHRGMIHTIPYGELRSITNYSRDWVIMKLEFRLPFGTDIEQVRKLIKQVGQEMQDSPDYGQYMLAPLKSQGVTRMDESGLVFRAKFTATPGEQFVMRREAYRLMQETLYESGIQFSNYQVTVQMPQDTVLSQEDQEAVNRAAAGAAASTVARQKAQAVQAGGDER